MPPDVIGGGPDWVALDVYRGSRTTSTSRSGAASTHSAQDAASIAAPEPLRWSERVPVWPQGGAVGGKAIPLGTAAEKVEAVLPVLQGVRGDLRLSFRAR
jgi:hypothetical protein